ncbi:hypothetical protein B0H14DRAFT_2735068 [Mycena olivaceomarginata]|nr:hypothetical protein B0H14DRAFT_2735068 [Mycena olivaceomarginata]
MTLGKVADLVTGQIPEELNFDRLNTMALMQDNEDFFCSLYYEPSKLAATPKQTQGTLTEEFVLLLRLSVGTFTANERIQTKIPNWEIYRNTTFTKDHIIAAAVSRNPAPTRVHKLEFKALITREVEEQQDNKPGPSKGAKGKGKAKRAHSEDGSGDNEQRKEEGKEA